MILDQIHKVTLASQRGNSGYLTIAGGSNADRLAAGGLPRDAVPSAAELTSLVSAAVGHRAAVGQWRAETVPYQSGSPATGALARLRGVTADGEPWSVFAKVLQHPRHWRLLDRVPDEVREDFLANFPWRAELGAWKPSFAGRLPAGLRVPALYRVIELPEDRVAVWMEDIAASDEAWTAARFDMAAERLGTLAANRRDPDLIAACPVPPGYGLRRYYDGKVKPVLPAAVTRSVGTPAHGRRRRSGTESGPGRAGRPRPGHARPARSAAAGLAPRRCQPAEPADPGRRTGHARGDRRRVPVPARGRVRPRTASRRTRPRRPHACRGPASHPRQAARRLHIGNGEREAARDLDNVQAGYIGSLAVRAAFTSLPFREPISSVTGDHIDQRIALTRFVADAACDCPSDRARPNAERMTAHATMRRSAQMS